MTILIIVSVALISFFFLTRKFGALILSLLIITGLLLTGVI